MAFTQCQGTQGHNLLLAPAFTIRCDPFVSRKQYRRQSIVKAESQQAPPQSLTRRHFGQQLLQLAACVPVLSLIQPGTAWGLGFKKELKKRKASADQYSSLDDGLKYFDQALGSGAVAEKGKKVKVHFDCMYKGIDVVSSRQARLLGGNRTISEPIEFVAGGTVAGAAVKKITDTANGLFAGASGPKPPPALSSAVLGMRTGGKRSVIVPPELGYGADGLQEIPPNGTFELEIELLSVG